MLQITPQMRILVAIQPADFRCGIDGLARVCKEVLAWIPIDLDSTNTLPPGDRLSPDRR